MTDSRLHLVVRWAFQSLNFHRVRSSLTVLAITLAACLVSSSIGFYVGCDHAVEHSVRAMGYQILVTGKGCPHEAATLILRGGSIPMYIRGELFQQIVNQPEVADATRFLLQTQPLDEGDGYQLFVGIDDAFLRLKPGVRFHRGEWFSISTADEVILGYAVAEYKRLAIGDTMMVRGRTLEVQGILDELGNQDDGTVFLPLLTAQSIFEKGDRMTGIGLRLSDLSLAGELINRIYDIPSVQVVRMEQVQSRILDIVHGVRTLLNAFAVLAVIVALLGITNAALLTANERRAEMGVLRAIGCSSGQLFLLVWAESLVLALCGAVMGAFATLVVRTQFESFLRSTLSYMPAGHLISVSVFSLVISSAVVIVLCMVAAIFPAWRSCRTSPLQSIRGVV